jgi:phosphopantothenoylcysteine decarboxylase/phosphopantothenate--cysteine ligase
MIMAPASANMIASCANGQCHNLMAAVYLSARCPVFFSPAMDLDMWKHPSTQKNIASLRSYGNFIIEPASGELASGLVGEGRMAEPEEIVKHLEVYFNLSRQMHDKHILITAGPTREMIDPVRYISNHSSGKMGYALAEELASRGAKVTLVSGPVSIAAKHPHIHVLKVQTADEMLQAAESIFPNVNAAIMTAAVADFKPRNPAAEKIKKSNSTPEIHLESTADILQTLALKKGSHQIVAGFALETNDGRANAESKVKNKNLDFIVLNELSKDNQVFGNDFNTIEIFGKHSGWLSFEKQTKSEAAKEIANYLEQLFNHA